MISLHRVTRLWRLTDREVKVLDLMLHGHSNSEIASTLKLSLPAGEARMDSIYRRMRVSDWRTLVFKLDRELQALSQPQPLAERRAEAA